MAGQRRTLPRAGRQVLRGLKFKYQLRRVAVDLARKQQSRIHSITLVPAANLRDSPRDAGRRCDQATQGQYKLVHLAAPVRHAAGSAQRQDVEFVYLCHFMTTQPESS